MSELSKDSEKTSDIDEKDEIVYTHPIVTKKKGYMNLMDYERNYRDMEARAKMQNIEKESMEPKVQDDQLKERGNFTTIPSSSTNENDRTRYIEEPKATTSRITEIKTRKHKTVSISEPREMDDSGDDLNRSELTDISPEEAYVRHLERIISANVLPPQKIEILKDLYTSYKAKKKYASTIEGTRTKTDIDTSNLGESKTDTPDQIENASIPDDEESVLDSNPPLKEPSNVIQSSTQEVSKNSILPESSAMDDEKIGSLENTDLFNSNDDILTSTPNTSKENIPTSSNLNDINNFLCDVTNMTIESPFSDFTLQKVKLKTGLRDLDVIKEEDNNVVEKHDNKRNVSVIEEDDNEEINVSGIDQNEPTSSSVSSNSQYPTSLDTWNNIQLSHPRSVLEIRSNKLFLTEDDLACRCPQMEADAVSNESNDVESVPDRIRRYFLSLLTDYLLPRQIRSNNSKIPCM